MRLTAKSSSTQQISLDYPLKSNLPDQDKSGYSPSNLINSLDATNDFDEEVMANTIKVNNFVGEWRDADTTQEHSDTNKTLLQIHTQTRSSKLDLE